MAIKKRTIGTILACFIVLWLNGGSFALLGSIPAAVKFGVVFFWLVIAMDTDETFFRRYLRIGVPVFAAMLLMVVSNLSGRVVYFHAYFMLFMYLAIIQALFAYYFFTDSTLDRGVILFVFVADVCVVAVRTFLAVLENPIIVRALSTSSQLKLELLEGVIPRGLGSYGLCYQLAFLVPCVAYIFNEKIHNALVKWLLYLAIVLTLFQFQITMALMIAVAFLIGCEIIRGSGGSKLVLCSKVGLVVLLVLMMVNLESILELVIEYANSSLAVRLKELLDLRSVGIAGTQDLSARVNLYATSATSFLENPLWGTFGNGPFGAHSTCLDILAAFGILGFTGIFGICKPMVILYRERYGYAVERRYVFWIIAAFLAFATVNAALWSNIMLVSNFVIPLVFGALRNETEEEQE